MRAEILKMLRESDGYVSGQQLCEKLGVSRTAVWKAVNRLKEEGYQVEAVRNRGYHIIDSPDVMTRQELSSLIKTAWAGQKIYYYDIIDSTNTCIKRLGEEGAPHGTLVAADQQSAGRGRRGRAWESPPGGSIYMSLLLRPDISPAKAPMLTLVMALAVAAGLKECTGLEVQIKWPNDIVLKGKKLAGILTEMSTEIDCINYVVIGTGINVNVKSLPKELSEKATSLFAETGQKVKRSKIIAAVMSHFEASYNIFEKTRSMKELKEQYNSLLVNDNREVRVLGEKAQYDGVSLGINEQGELLVRRKDGTVEAVFAGEVSVRGIYGYV